MESASGDDFYTNARTEVWIPMNDGEATSVFVRSYTGSRHTTYHQRRSRSVPGWSYTCVTPAMKRHLQTPKVLVRGDRMEATGGLPMSVWELIELVEFSQAPPLPYSHHLLIESSLDRGDWTKLNRILLDKFVAQATRNDEMSEQLREQRRQFRSATNLLVSAISLLVRAEDGIARTRHFIKSDEAKSLRIDLLDGIVDLADQINERDLDVVLPPVAPLSRYREELKKAFSGDQGDPEDDSDFNDTGTASNVSADVAGAEPASSSEAVTNQGI